MLLRRLASPGVAATLALLLAAALAVLLAGCAGGSPPGRPAVSDVPLVPGTRVASSVRRCDGGEHPYCAREIVLVARAGRYVDAGVLKVAERRVLAAHGWRRAEGATFDESAAESPGNRLRVTYATAEEDLISIDERRITRAPGTVRALSATLFARRAGLSLLLQVGSG